MERTGHYGPHHEGQAVVGEVPPPTKQVGGGSTEEREHGQNGRDDRRVLPEEASSLSPRPVVGYQHDHQVDEARRPQTLDDPDGQQPPERRTEPAQAAEDSEDQEARDEDPLTPVTVG